MTSLRRSPARALRRLLGTRPPTPAHPPELEDALVWMLGSPRTGSTWILNLLGRITGAPMIDEPLVGTHLATPSSVITGMPAVVDDELVVDKWAQHPGYLFASAQAHVWQPAFRDMVLRRFAAAIPTGPHELVLVKEPHGSAGAPALMSCFSRSRLLFLVRDGRDVVDSIMDGVDGGWISRQLGVDVERYGGRRPLLEIRARQWVRDVGAVQQAYADHDPSRRLLVRYEDVVAEPISEVTRIVEWLGAEAPPDRIVAAVDALDTSRMPAHERGKGQFVRSATPGLWQEHFDADERAVLDDVMGPLLGQFGY